MKVIILNIISPVTKVLASDPENPFTKSPKNFFGVPIEVAYAFVVIIFILAIAYGFTRWVFGGD